MTPKPDLRVSLFDILYLINGTRWYKRPCYNGIVIATAIARSRYSLTLNNSEMVRDTDVVAMEY